MNAVTPSQIAATYAAATERAALAWAEQRCTSCGDTEEHAPTCRERRELDAEQARAEAAAKRGAA